MKNVLIVDDEKPFIQSLLNELKSYKREFNVFTAENGEKALVVLEKVPLDLVVTDLRMPIMDGFELLASMSKNNPGIPVIVMTAYATPEIDKKLKSLDILQYIEKPFDFEAFVDKIFKELAKGSEGHIHGVTLPAFLQLVEMEKKTCTLAIKSDKKEGKLYFNKGELIDAETEKLKGEEAAFDIVCWENPEIEIDRVCIKKKKNISFALSYLLMEAFRLKDEKENGLKSNIKKESIGEGGFTFDSPENYKKTGIAKEDIMALEKHLEGLKEIKGYKAAGIMNFTGELMASDSADKNIDLVLVGATFNDIFRYAHEASKKIGLDACKETVINTPKGIIVMRCSGTDAKAHFHIIGIMAADGNQALMKMQIEKMVPAVLEELK